MSHVPIRVSTLRGDQPIDFNAYVKINDKFILYLRQGDSFEGPRLQRLKEKKLKKMFILPEDEANYRAYLSRNIDMAYDKNSGKPLENRAQIVQGAQQSNAEAVMEDPTNMAAYNDAKDAALRFVEFLGQDEKAVASILNVENLDKSIAHHGVTVSTLANRIAARVGLVDPKLRQMLTLGALLHDFEHFYSELDIARPIAAMSETELKVYKSHPMNGAQRVQTQKHFDQSVINIIAQHEEFIDGKGWPQGLKESQMDPLAVFVASANSLDRIITFQGKRPKDAAKELFVSSVGKHPLQHLQILSELMAELNP